VNKDRVIKSVERDADIEDKEIGKQDIDIDCRE
jgi:hypothetical protein